MRPHQCLASTRTVSHAHPPPPTRSYEDEYWFFELITIIRKLLLTGVIVLLANMNSKLIQLLAAIIVCLVYLVLVTSYQPFVDVRDDRLAVAEALQMLLTMIIALALSLNDDGDAETTEYLGYLLIALTVFVLALAVYQLPLLDCIQHFCCCCCCCKREPGSEEQGRKWLARCRKPAHAPGHPGYDAGDGSLKGDPSMGNITRGGVHVERAERSETRSETSSVAAVAAPTTENALASIATENVLYQGNARRRSSVVMESVVAEAEAFLKECVTRSTAPRAHPPTPLAPLDSPAPLARVRRRGPFPASMRNHSLPPLSHART